MKTVWILIVMYNFYHGGGPTVIDNIASKEECQRVQQLLPESGGANVTVSRCIEVKKMP